MVSRWLTACLASRPDTSWDRDGEADGEEQCIAVADYERQQAGEIGLRAGQSVDVLEKSETGWWFVSGIDEQGWVPASFLEPHKEIRDSPPSRKPTDVAKRRRPHLKRLDRRWTLGGFTNRQPSRAEVRCIALQPYTAQDKDELGFEKGTSLDVLQQNTEGWWLVRHQGRQGWAPAHCLQRVPEDHTTRRKTALPPVEIVGTMMDVSNLPGRPWARRGSGGSGGSEPGCRLAGSVSGSSRSPNLAEKTRHTSATEHERKTPSSPAVARIAPQRPSNGSPERSPGGSPRRDASLQARGLQLPKPPAPPSVEMEYYTIAEFQTTISDGISFRGGQKVEVIEKCVSGWWYVQIGHDEGWAPASYIEKRKKVNLVRRTSNVTRPKVPPPAPPGRTRASSADGRHSNDRARGRETEANGRSPSTVREHIYDVPAVDCPEVITTIRSTRGNGSPRAVTKHTACTARAESPGSPRPVTATVSPSVISAQSRTTLTRGNPVLLSPRSTPRASVRPRLDSDGSETQEDIGRDGCRDITGRATLPRSNAQSVSEVMYEGSACLTQGRGVKPSLRPKPMTNHITSNPGGSPGRLEVGTVSRGINEAGPGSEKKEGVSEEIVNGIRTLGEIGSRTSAQSSQTSGGKNGTRHLEPSGKGEPYRAVARFEKVQNSELSLNEGDMVDVLEKKDGGWWFVRSGVDEGWVPASYLETRMSITSTGSISRIGLGSQVQKTNINGTDSDRWHSQDNSLPPKRPPPPKLSPSTGRHGGRRLPAPIEKSIRMENLESYSGARCHASPSSRILEKVKTLPAANNRASSSTDMNGAQRSSPRLSRRDPREVVAGTRRATQMHQTSSGGLSPRERSDVSTMENGTLSLGRSRSDRLQSRTFLGQALRAELISRPMPHSGDVYVAIADYAGDDETLGFDEGVSLEVIERHPNGWWYCKLLDGRCEDSEGWAPSNYLERKVLLGGCSIHTRYGEDSKKE